MKKLLFLITICLLSAAALAQFDDVQSASIYKINKVKTMLSRHADYGRQNCVLTTFNEQGKALKWRMFDKTGEKKWIENIFEYNSNNQLTKTFYCPYFNSGFSGKDIPDSILDSSRVNISLYKYDALGRLVKQTGTIGPDRTAYEISFYFNPPISVWKFYKYRDTLLTTHITEYEKPGLVKSFFSSYDSGKVTANTWQEVYQNIFDRYGKLVKRITLSPSEPSFCKETFFEYNEKGLLIKTYNHYRNELKDYNVQLYEYEYWDDCIPLLVALNERIKN
jgi:uncharacterized protein YxeA